MGERIFMTGATGVIGRRAVPLLLAAGHQVTGVARSSSGAAMLQSLGARVAFLDPFDLPAASRAVEGHDVVVNLATHMPSSNFRMMLPWAWRENDRLRRDASSVLVRAARAADVQRFVQESFAPVYPGADDGWIDERVPIQPSHYNASVADAERSAVRFSEGGGTGVVLRFSFFYGPDARLTGDLIKLAQKGWAGIPGRAEAYISSVSHNDAATAVIAALQLPAGVYNVTDDEPLTRREYFDVLASALGVPRLRLPPPWICRFLGSLGEMLGRSLRISNRKLREASGWTPVYPSMREGWPATLSSAELHSAR